MLCVERTLLRGCPKRGRPASRALGATRTRACGVEVRYLSEYYCSMISPVFEKASCYKLRTVYEQKNSLRG